jgi:Type I phosphodiesterase / nucleotide pyrophosphatase
VLHLGLLRPRYDSESLACVLPAVVDTLGVTLPGGAVRAEMSSGLVPARRAVVVLIDGLGYEQLRRRSGHAPFLRSLLPSAQRLGAGFPSTTATSMGTFGTGLPPGAHGLLGYEVLVPGEDRLVNELSWENGPDPFRWQPEPTVFERMTGSGVSVTRVGPGFFEGSGLTNAALRGGRFRAAESLADRVTATVAALVESPRALVFLYWGDLDKVGHVHGAGSWEWGQELETIDGELRRLTESVPMDTSITMTSDHGMVDAPHALRIDVAHDIELDAGIRHIGGEPRAPQLYCESGAVDDVLATWRGRVEERAWIRSREEAVAQGWFGPVEPRNLPRIGDVVVAMRDNFAIVDSRRLRPQLLALVGLHGSLTEEEASIPFIHVPPRHTA